MSYEIYRARRGKLAQQLGESGVALIPSGTIRHDGKYVVYPFRQESNFAYLTGWSEPDTLLLLTGGNKSRSVLFWKQKNKRDQIWTGAHIGVLRTVVDYGFDEAHEIPENESLYTYLKKFTDPFEIVACPGVAEGPFAFAIHGLERMRGIHDVKHLIGEMRVIKDALEIDLMRESARLAASAHRSILPLIKPWMHEYEIEAEIIRAFKHHGADHAYPPIVASGRNALVMHYHKNRSRIHPGDFVLIDAGCEQRGHASDVTRTVPALGYFTPAQRLLYDLLRQAKISATEKIQPGSPFNAPHVCAVEVLTEGLLSLGIIRAPSLEIAIAEKLYEPFFPHSTGHFIGRDVHDAGDYHAVSPKHSERPLLAGMVVTVEPGIYIPPSRDIPDQFWDMGLRIEDVVLVTENGHEVLSVDAPEDPDEIEVCMAQSRSSSWW